jgi:competence protein ComGF
MSKTKLKKLQKLEVRLISVTDWFLFCLLLLGIYSYCLFGYVQEEKRNKLLQAQSIEILQYAPYLILYRMRHA